MEWTRHAALVALLFAGCAARDVPYQFRGDLVGGVSAAKLPPPRRPKPVAKRVAKRAPKPVAKRAPTRERENRPPRRAAARPLVVPVPRAARLPKREIEATAKIAEPAAQQPASSSLASRLRGFVGERDKRASHVEFVWRALAALGIQPDASIARARTGRSLVSVARDRDAVSKASVALLGDLVVFDAVVGNLRASLIGVVITTAPGGTIEFVYLGRGVVRRGFVNPARPTESRDKSGRVLNTFVRHSDGGDPRGTKYLAGRLIAGVVQLDRLVASSTGGK